MEQKSKLKDGFGRHPPIKWAQRYDELYITVELPDAKDVKVTLEPEGKFYFSATAGAEKIPYEVNLDLFDKVDVKNSKASVGSRNIILLVKKAERKWWDRMLKQGGKAPVFLKVDWDKWIDEDEEPKAGKPGNDMDFGDINFSKLNMGGGEGLDDDVGDNDEYPLRNSNTLFQKPSRLTEKSNLEEAFKITEDLLHMLKKMVMGGSSNKVKLALAYLNSGLKRHSKEHPAEVISFVNTALKELDTNCHSPLLVPLALYSAGSVNLGLRRFSDSLGYLNRTNNILGNLPDDVDSLGDLNKERVFYAVQLNLVMAHTAVENYKEALPFCLKVLEIDKKRVGQNGVDIAYHRKFLEMIYFELGEHEKALEQNVLSQRTFKNWNPQSDLSCDEINAANIMIAMGRYDEAVGTLKNVVQQTDVDCQTQVLVFISMARALYNQEKFGDCKRYLEISLEILGKREQTPTMEVVDGYLKISILYETMNDFESSILLLKRALALLEKLPEEQFCQGKSSARIGHLLLLTLKMQQAIPYLKSAVESLKCSYGPKHLSMGYIYNNLGEAYSKLGRPQSAVEMFAIAKDIMDVSLGPDHLDTIAVCQKLSKAYDDMGSRHPPIKWAQRSEELYITVELPDAQDVKVTLEPEGKFYFSATAGEEKIPYEFNIYLFDKVDVNNSKASVGSRNIFYLVKKAESKWWDRLLKLGEKPPVFLKVDLDKWVDEDKEQEADKSGIDMDVEHIDFSNLCMGGGAGLDAHMADNNDDDERDWEEASADNEPDSKRHRGQQS